MEIRLDVLRRRDLGVEIPHLPAHRDLQQKEDMVVPYHLTRASTRSLVAKEDRAVRVTDEYDPFQSRLIAQCLAKMPDVLFAIEGMVQRAHLRRATGCAVLINCVAAEL